jgi:hypothetical protein
MSPRGSFSRFYEDVFLPEHRAAPNVFLHVLGTVLGVVLVPAGLASPWPWVVLLWPVVHAVPGLIGRRLFERHEEVGDVRVVRRDHPLLFFVLANHRMTFDVPRGAWPEAHRPR